MSSLLRRSLAEALGTFALVFIGVGVVAAKSYPDANYGIYRHRDRARDGAGSS